MIKFTVLVVLLSVASMVASNKDLEANFEVPQGSILHQSYYQELMSSLNTSDLMDAQDLAAEFKKRAGQREIFAELASLSNPSDATCSMNLVKSVLDIFGLINESLVDQQNMEFASKYSSYLKQYGRDKFAACAAKTADEFAKVSVDSEAEEALDKLVGAGQADADDRKLFELATVFEGAASETMLAECARIQEEPLAHIFNVYNLARILAKSGAQPDLPEVPVKFLKLNEYNRICMV